ncbi:SPOR domain-containing protein [Falsarthrobacter nasiphocae]|uniref:Biopterin-dependent aromatic amino acid hydroxylase family profile domain-containing protein n=1 Tax=Falsarthrobacter nasiphocae TaxID=189863 RepID=A0AAE3YDQ7_9MICC|nr:SPOR domain-containing protein [Falsarthrobacter nasiphocae]MDR6891300.1 hypothetical protein [Falsarthrobacter nasiphocae]
MAAEYWFNLDTNTVEEGDGSNKAHLMGPYPTYEAAAHALEQAHANTERWDAEDEADELER